MKPITEFIQRIDRHHLSQGERKRRRRPPSTDYSFQSDGMEGNVRASRPRTQSPFREISRQYSSHEATVVFLCETALFCVITAIAVFSLIDCAGALTSLL